MIYLASPYNHESAGVRQGRYLANVRALVSLVRAGRVAFSPIVHNHPVASSEGFSSGWEFWKNVDTEFLRRSDRLVVLKLDGWQESVGVRAEMELAAELGLPVEYMEPV